MVLKLLVMMSPFMVLNLFVAIIAVIHSFVGRSTIPVPIPVPRLPVVYDTASQEHGQ